MARRTRRAASDWMPWKAAIDHVTPFVGRSDFAIEDIFSRLRSGELCGARRLSADAPPVPEKPKFWSVDWPVLTGPGNLDDYGNPLRPWGEIFVLRTDVMKIWGADQAAASDLARRAGRPPKFDWLAIDAEIFRRIVTPDRRVKLPTTDAKLANDIAQWCQDKFGDEPANSDIRERIRKLLAPLRK